MAIAHPADFEGQEGQVALARQPKGTEHGLDKGEQLAYPNLMGAFISLVCARYTQLRGKAPSLQLLLHTLPNSLTFTEPYPRPTEMVQVKRGRS